VVGALLGIGVVKGLHIVNLRTLTRVVIWWVASPVIAAAVGYTQFAQNAHGGWG
jgi:phosphate/sulfate permease